MDTAILGPRDASKWDSYEIGELFVIKNGDNDYIGWYAGRGADGYQIGCVTSDDGISWTRASDTPVLTNENPTSVWMRAIYVMMKNDKYLMWYTGANNQYISMDPGKVCFAISEDGINWRRDKLYNPIFRNGGSGAWDERSVSVRKIIKRDDHYEMLYAGADDDWDHISYGTAIYKPTEMAGGNISGTWTKEGSPYLIKGGITIPNGETLTIEPGTVVEFCGYYPLNVQGRLLAEGTASNKIKFWRNDTTGFKNINGNYGAWSGIRLIDTPSYNDSSIISYCDIAFGKAQEYNYGSYGGGLVVLNFDRIRLENCHIHHNYAIGYDSQKNAAGGGIYIQESNMIVNENIIEYNLTRHISRELAASGGGMVVLYPAETKITNNTIRQNRSSEDGGGIAIWSSSNAYLANNLIIENTSLSNSEGYGAGGGVSIRLNSSPVLINNTIADNTAVRGGGIAIDHSDAGIFNTILANNHAFDTYEQLRLYNVSDKEIYIYFSCLEGQPGYEWEYASTLDTSGIITDDPRLYSNYNLSSLSSPCICGGRSGFVYKGRLYETPITDHENDSRPQPVGMYSDIGAIESSRGSIVDTTGSVNVFIIDIPDHFSLSQNYPNPFNPRTMINYQLSADSEVELTIYDITGRKITTLINNYQPAGYHTINWDASSFPSGIYFYRLKTRDYIETKKMVLMK